MGRKTQNLMHFTNSHPILRNTTDQCNRILHLKSQNSIIETVSKRSMKIRIRLNQVHKVHINRSKSRLLLTNICNSNRRHQLVKVLHLILVKTRSLKVVLSLKKWVI
jgi:hypothetical protein